MPWEHVAQLTPALKRLKEDGYTLIAVEQDKKSISRFEYAKQHKYASRRIALVLGNEVSGLPKSILAQADTIIEIPMRGKKESLNVSVAAGVALFVIRGAS